MRAAPQTTKKKRYNSNRAGWVHSLSYFMCAIKPVYDLELPLPARIRGYNIKGLATQSLQA